MDSVVNVVANVKASFQAIDVYKSLPYWAALVIVGSCYPAFMAPIYAVQMYWEEFDMTPAQYARIIPAATIGTYVTLVPGELAKRGGARTVLLAAAALTGCAYGYGAYEYKIGSIEGGAGAKVVVVALLCGQAAGFFKMAGIVQTVDSVDSSVVGTCLGIVLGSVELANFLYTDLTRIWVQDLFFITTATMSTPPEAILTRRLIIPIAAMLCVPAFYSTPSTVLANRRDLNTNGLLIAGSLVLMACFWNWENTWYWCHKYDWSSEGLYTSFKVCMLPWAVCVTWGASIAGVVGMSALMVYRHGWLESTPPDGITGGVAGAYNKGLARESTLGDSDEKGGGETTPLTTGVVEERLTVEEGKEESSQANVVETAVASGNRDSSSGKLEVWSRQTVGVAFVTAVTIGIGQAIGNNNFWVGASLGGVHLLGTGWLEHDSMFSFFNGSLSWTGFYITSKIVGSVMVGWSWDASAPDSQRRRDIVRNVPLTLAVSQFVFAVSGALVNNDNTLLYLGLATSGWATGAMHTLVPVLLLEWYPRESFVRLFSTVMSAAALGLLTFQNGVMYEDWRSNHMEATDDGSVFMQYSAISNFSAFDSEGWGGCFKHPACYEVSYCVQCAACLAATWVAVKVQPAGACTSRSEYPSKRKEGGTTFLR